MEQRKIRIGIDVGGTFTHAVAIDNERFELAAQIKLPTTHKAEEGVAKGIIDSLLMLLEEAGIKPEEVVMVAHSTTQATNALLEGDVAPVGIIGMGSGVEKDRAMSETRVEKIELAPKRFLKTYHKFIDTSGNLSEIQIKTALNELTEEGAEAIVAAEAFSVDNTSNEELVMKVAREMQLPATATHEIAQLYGLKIRTRTAVINASMLPKMIQTADMTERCVREAGIKAPLMIMRSDGGVMDIEGMRKRPILTMLSGPAAGVAAALMYVKISDGIFLEVGGTSTDISAISRGRAVVRSAEVGGHRLYLRTLDVRTVGVAGGSMVRVKDDRIVDVGPRSAHIAGVPYASFCDGVPAASTLKSIQPKPEDPDDYTVVTGNSRNICTITPTCASNLTGLVGDGDYAKGDMTAIRMAMGLLADNLNLKPDDAANEILKVASAKNEKVVEDLLKDYDMDRSIIALVGGGGGASALVPYAAKSLKLDHYIADNNAVISAIGAGLAMVRDSIEKSIINPTDTDLINIRREAEEAVISMGANKESIDIVVEVDTQQNLVRATASGSLEMRTQDRKKTDMPPDQMKAVSARSMHIEPSEVTEIGSTKGFKIFTGNRIKKRLFGLIKSKNTPVRVIDNEGIIRFGSSNALVMESTGTAALSGLTSFIDDHTEFGDGGRLLPGIFSIFRSRILDLSGLVTKEQVLSVARLEFEGLSAEERVFLIKI